MEDIVLARADISAGAVFKFFPCRSDGQWLIIYSPDGSEELERFYFGRQAEREGLCLSDYAQPVGDGPDDYVAMFVTTVGPGVRDLSEKWKSDGRYLDSHTLQALAIESAEGFAELLHKRIRNMWNIGEGSGMRVPMKTKNGVCSGHSIAANGFPLATRRVPDWKTSRNCSTCWA